MCCHIGEDVFDEDEFACVWSIFMCCFPVGLVQHVTISVLVYICMNWFNSTLMVCAQCRLQHVSSQCRKFPNFKLNLDQLHVVHVCWINIAAAVLMLSTTSQRPDGEHSSRQCHTEHESCYLFWQKIHIHKWCLQSKENHNSMKTNNLGKLQ